MVLRPRPRRRGRVFVWFLWTRSPSARQAVEPLLCSSTPGLPGTHACSCRACKRVQAYSWPTRSQARTRGDVRTESALPYGLACLVDVPCSCGSGTRRAITGPGSSAPSKHAPAAQPSTCLAPAWPCVVVGPLLPRPSPNTRPSMLPLCTCTPDSKSPQTVAS